MGAGSLVERINGSRIQSCKLSHQKISSRVEDANSYLRTPNSCRRRKLNKTNKPVNLSYDESQK